MEEKTATLKLFLNAAGRLQKATLILNDSSEELFLTKKEKLLDHVKGRVLRNTKEGFVFIKLPFHSVRRAAVWKLDVEDEVTGLSIQMVDQKGAKVPLPRSAFRNPQYF